MSKKTTEGFGFGLPRKICGNPRLGCSCHTAYLESFGSISRDGEIEADYMCESGWHNYVVLKLKQLKDPIAPQIKIDANGNLTEDVTTKPPELEEY